MSSWNGIHFRSAYFLSWPSGKLYDNLILPVKPGSVKPILILLRVDHGVCRGPGRADLQAARSNGVQPGSESPPERKIKLQLTKCLIGAELWVSSRAWALMQSFMLLLVPTCSTHCCTDHLEEQHLRCGILNNINSMASSLTGLQGSVLFLVL